MSLRTSIQRAAWMIKEVTYWLSADIKEGAFASPDSMTAIELETASRQLRETADQIDEHRRNLIGNAPPEYRIAAE